MTDKPFTPVQAEQDFKALALIICNLAKHSADIAHARRVMYQAYLSEGFTEAQALELCKHMLLS